MAFVRVVPIHDYENGQDNEHTQAKMRLLGLYNVPEKHEYTYQHGTEYTQEKTDLPFAGARYMHEFENRQGTEHTQVEMRPGGSYNVPERHEYTNQQGIEYIREKTYTPFARGFPTHEYIHGQGNKNAQAVVRFRWPYDVSEKYKYTNQQGTEYIREKTNTPTAQVLPRHEYVPGQGQEHTRAATTLRWPYNVPEKYEHTNQQGIEYIREKTHTPHVQVLPTHEYENQHGMEHIQPTMKSPVWTKKQHDWF